MSRVNRTQHGMTLVELLVTLTLLVIVLAPVLSLFGFAFNQWGVQSSAALAMQQTTLALDSIEHQVRNAVSFTTITVSGNTVYTFMLPGSQDSNGNYLPVIQSSQGANVEAVIGYSAGNQVAYYLSDNAGALATNGGTALWSATMPVGQSSWTPSSAWSLDSTSQPRYRTVQSFTITPDANLSGYANSVTISITGAVTQGQQTRTFTLTRQVYLMNSGM